jgi:hypothetical protein
MRCTRKNGDLSVWQPVLQLPEMGEGEDVVVAGHQEGRDRHLAKAGQRQWAVGDPRWTQPVDYVDEVGRTIGRHRGVQLGQHRRQVLHAEVAEHGLERWEQAVSGQVLPNVDELAHEVGSTPGDQEADGGAVAPADEVDRSKLVVSSFSGRTRIRRRGAALVWCGSSVGGASHG